MTELFLDVSERFYSIQGESTWAGLPCLFIRLSGCNLRCNYCDSSYTWEETGKMTSVGEILSWVDEFPGTMIELTGGEPLLQKEVYPLIDKLLGQGRTVLVETNGSINIDKIPQTASIILDIKCPDSNMDSSMNWDNIEQLFKRANLGSHDEVKFVLSSEQDFIWAKKLCKNINLTRLSQSYSHQLRDRLNLENWQSLFFSTIYPYGSSCNYTEYFGPNMIEEFEYTLQRTKI